MIWPSVEAESRVLNERETVRTLAGVRCPKSDPAGCKSTDLAVELYVHIDTTQSVPEVTNVRESAKIVQDNCPICKCSK